MSHRKKRLHYFSYVNQGKRVIRLWLKWLCSQSMKTRMCPDEFEELNHPMSEKSLNGMVFSLFILLFCAVFGWFWVVLCVSSFCVCVCFCVWLSGRFPSTLSEFPLALRFFFSRTSGGRRRRWPLPSWSRSGPCKVGGQVWLDQIHFAPL